MHTEFTPIASTLGGLLIGTSAALMLAFNGRITGISGILGGLLDGCEGRTWRSLFLAGLVLGGLGLLVVMPQAMPGAAFDSLPWLIGAGLLVGVGTRMGGGCTSGHGVCGISRLSVRSMVATGLFMGAAMLTTGITRHVLNIGGAG